MKKVVLNSLISGILASIAALIILTIKDIITYGWQGFLSVLVTFAVLLPICIVICFLAETIKYVLKKKYTIKRD